jgi:hypothetical protein
MNRQPKESIVTEKKNPLDLSYKEIMSKWHDEQKTRSEVNRAKLTQLLSTQPEIACIEVKYNGFGDDGQVEDLVAYDGNNGLLPLHDSFHDAVEDLVFDLLQDHFPGWYASDGCSGLITIDAKTLQGTIAHDWYVTQCEDVEFEI